jgi:hypothetical protein
LTDKTQVRPSRASSPVKSTFSFLAMPALAHSLVICAGQRPTEAGQMGAAVALRDVVGEGSTFSW